MKQLERTQMNAVKAGEAGAAKVAVFKAGSDDKPATNPKPASKPKKKAKK